MKSILLLISGILLGAVGTIGGTWWIRKSPSEPVHQVRYHPATSLFNDAPESLLYPPGTTLETIFPDELARTAILAPDSVRIHLRANGGDGEKVGEWKFIEQGIKPDAATQERLLYALASISSYEPPGKACIFDPGVLVRFTKDGRAYDLLFCFECGDMQGAKTGHAGAGMSLNGAKTFLKCFCDIFPTDAALRQKRERLETRHP